jgi:D-xylose transport system permease protein
MAAPQQAPASPRETDFGTDRATGTTVDAVRHSLRAIGKGDLGSLPAMVGLAVLFVVFTALDRSGTFLSLLNLANLLQQGAGQTIMAMGLVFVLLSGQIDLAAGTASGLTAGVMALYLVTGGQLDNGTGTMVYLAFLALSALAAGLAMLLRLWPAAIACVLGIVLAVAGVANAWVAMLLAVCVGVVIGCLTGFLVAKLAMPSFVVTLALFITWQGAILQLIGDGGALGLRSPEFSAVANENLPVWASWLLYVVAAGGYAVIQVNRQRIRVTASLARQPTGMVLLKIGAVAVLGGVATYLLTRDRSPGIVAISGIPYVVPIVLVLLALGHHVLARTSFGRHVYAVGGNSEAARRAGIDVVRVRAAVFVISTGFAAVGAIVYSSKVGSVSPSSGGGNTLLFAIGAAVIGGTSLFGGRGRIGSAVIGGAVLATVNNGLGLLGQPAAVVFMVNGLVLLLAAAVDVLSRRRAALAG